MQSNLAIKEACRIFGISKNTFISRLKAYGLSKKKQWPIDSIIDIYLNSELSTTQVASKFNVPRNTLLDILKRNDIKLKKYCKYDSSLKEKLLGYYIDKQLSIRQIAIILGMDEDTISRYLTKFDIDKRPKVKHTCNDYYFDIPTANSAYILGLIVTDGCISGYKHQSLAYLLQRKDEQILKFITKQLQFSGPIYRFSTNIDDIIRYYSSISIHSIHIVNTLAKIYSIIPRKTGKEQFPFKLPIKYYGDWLRGVIDGDGTICISNGKTQFGIYSANPSFLEQINATILNNQCYIYKKLYEKTGNYCYVLQSAKKQVIKNIYDIAYSGFNGNFCLDRKYDKFREAIKL